MADKKTWWSVAGVAAGLALAVVVMLASGIGCGSSADEEDGAEDVTTTEEVSAGEDREGGDVGETLTWTNDRSRLSGAKAANFVPFSFEYPADWRVIEDGTQPDDASPNFVKVERATDDQITIENFAVGWYSGAGASDVVTMLEPQFAGSFPNYQKVADQASRIDGIDSPGFLFQARIDAPSGPVRFYGRALAVPVGDANGILIIMFASDLAEGVDSPEDVGEKGRMPVIMETFDIQE